VGKGEIKNQIPKVKVASKKLKLEGKGEEIVKYNML
jgi:hypothetical protein